MGDGLCMPGLPGYPQTDYVTLSCGGTTITGEGDTLTIDWAARPDRCFDGDCGWNTAWEMVVSPAVATSSSGSGEVSGLPFACAKSKAALQSVVTTENLLRNANSKSVHNSFWP